MIQTFHGLRTRVMRLLDESDEITSATSTTRQLVDDALNYAHQQRCTEYPWSFMRWPGALTFSTVPGQQLYSLHYEFDKPIDFLNLTTKTYLREIPQRLREATGVDVDQPQGSVQHFSFAGYSPVRLPMTAGALTVVSDSASDTGTANQVVIKGETTAGEIVGEILTPAGLTPVESSYDYRAILGFTKETEWVGNLTLSDSASTTLLTLLPYEMGRRYPLIQFAETPTGVESIQYRFYRQPLVLVNDYDQPEIPPPYAQLLVWDALIQMSAYLTELPASKLQTWQIFQQQSLLALQQAWGADAQTLGTLSTTVRMVNPYD